MRRPLCALLVFASLFLWGCGKSTTELEAELSTSRQETQALKERLDTLEGRVQAIEASMPEEGGAQ